ncbi:helix-turn-helix domain-containing protein [Streptomyces sp. NPDC091416]|uniref:helix-turn-helix domain-containing protein n=1 Tax=Streptomyces sp. NPDC091416 TaxID=3366003 RepID=UPI00381BB1D6
MALSALRFLEKSSNQPPGYWGKRMLTLASLLESDPAIDLATTWPTDPVAYQSLETTGLTMLSFPQLLDGQPYEQLPQGHVVMVCGAAPNRLRGRAETAVEELLRRMGASGCPALVMNLPGGVQHPFPQSIRDLGDELDIPFLLTTASQERWVHAGSRFQRFRIAEAERRAIQLDSLVRQLPSQLSDSTSMQRIADWLATALDVHVLVSEPERVLAASPTTAAEQLAQAVIRRSSEAQVAGGVSLTPYTQLIPLAPATGADTVLAIVSRRPIDEGDMPLLLHAAKLLGLIDQAHRDVRAATGSSRAVKAAAVALLLDGEVDKARRVLSNLSPGFLAKDTARIFVIETSRSRRDAAVARAENVTARRALVVPDPRANNRVLIVHPDGAGAAADDSVADELTRLVAVFGPEASLGGSGLYSLALLSEALQEASAAQKFALLQNKTVALSAQNVDLVSLLPQADAQIWAQCLLRPLMEPAGLWGQLRETLPAALEYPYTVAARRLNLHRNTVTRRVSRAAELLHLDLGVIANRVAVGLALELVTHRKSSVSSAHDGARPPSLRSLLAAPQVLEWGNTLLGAAVRDRRDLVTTATTWLDSDTHVEPAARNLGLSEVTVRSHLRALEKYLSRDLASLCGIRDLQFSLYVVNGRPRVGEFVHALSAAA